VPACLETTVVDVTGCGNAFCGAFLASYAAGEGLLQAGLWGCAAASMIAEQQGVPPLPVLQFRQPALQRLEALRPRVAPGRAPAAAGEAMAAGAGGSGRGSVVADAASGAGGGSRLGSAAGQRLVLPLQGGGRVRVQQPLGNRQHARVASTRFSVL
jgi:hypothetical protein